MEETLKKLGEIEIQFELLKAQKAQLIRKSLEHLANGQHGNTEAAQTGEVETFGNAPATKDQSTSGSI